MNIKKAFSIAHDRNWDVMGIFFAGMAYAAVTATQNIYQFKEKYDAELASAPALDPNASAKIKDIYCVEAKHSGITRLIKHDGETMKITCP